MASRFWVGGTGNWDAADTTHWAATSGGAGGQSVPGSSDDVTFDGSSGGGTVTVTASQTTLSITGGAHTGTVNFNGQTISTGIFSWTGTSTRTLTFGSSSITCTGTSTTVFRINDITNLTITANTATITLSGAGSSIQNTASLNLNGASIVFSGSGSQTTTGALTCANFTRTGTAAKTDTLSLSGNLTCTSTYTVNSNSGINRVLIQSGTVGTARTITAATWAVTNTDFQDITGAGAGSRDFSAQTDVGDCGGNSGITFPASVAQTWSGTSGGNWSTNAWTTRVPLPQDDVTISSAFSASQTVTADMPRLGRSISLSGATGSPGFTIGTPSSIYGSLTLISGITFNAGNILTYQGRGSYTITTAGNSFATSAVFTAPTGTYALQDAFTGAANFNINNGTVNTNNFSVTALTINATGSGTRSLVAGTSILTVTTTAATNAFNFVAAGLTLDAASSQMVISTASANTRTFGGGTLTYGTLTYTVAGSTGGLDITGSNSFAQINFSDVTNARTLRFTAATTTTIRNVNGFNVQGTSGKLMTVSSITGATHTLASTSRQVCSYLNVSYSIASAGLFYAQTTSTDGLNNTNWIFTDAPLLSTGGGSNGIQNRMNLQNLRSLV